MQKKIGKARTTVKVKFYTYIVNGGDGSAYLRVFKTKKAAETYQEYEENNSEAFCETYVKEHKYEIDSKGNLLIKDPIHPIQEEELRKAENECEEEDNED